MNTPKIIAFYLPQFHPTPENDEWWGKGFTEWTNVGRAKPLFWGHYEPRVPADLGYYDLRVAEVRVQQAELAREAGVYGFCYWHYWFGNGKRLLSSIWDSVIESGEPNFPICLGWANHSWYAKLWDKKSADRLLMEQKYLGASDYRDHFELVVKAFKDERYIRVGEKPLFFIYDALAVPQEFLDLWNKWAKESGFSDGVCFVGRLKSDSEYEKVKEKGFDFVTVERMPEIASRMSTLKRRFRQLFNYLILRPCNCYNYREAYPFFVSENEKREDTIPMIIPCWDHSPRSTSRGFILHKSTPDLFKSHTRQVLGVIKDKPKDKQIVFLKSWNEWAEGNYMEPDLKWGKGYINALREELDNGSEE